MLLGRVSGHPFDALLDHADGPRGRRVFVVHLLSAAGRSDVEPFLLSAEE